MKRRKQILAAILAVVVFATLFSACGKKGGTKETVKILNNHESLCLAPVHIAITNGYFDEEFKKIGQKYELVNSNIDTLTEQISSKEINAAYGLTGSLMQPISNGLDIVFTSGLHTGCTKYYVKADSGINKLEDLKGKKVGVPSLSDSSVINLKRKLNDLGFKVNGDKPDVTFAAYNMPDLPAALDNGGVDAIGIHDPVATTAERSYNFRKILDVGTDAKFKNEYCCQAFVSGDLYKYNPEGAAAYTRAIQKAAAFIEAEPYEAARLQIQKGYMPGPESGNAQNNGDILAGFNFTPSVSLGRKTFESSFKDLQKTGDIPKTLDEKEFQAKVYPTLKGVPDSYTYDSGTKTFKEVKSSSGTKADSAIGVEAQARTPAKTTTEHKEQNDCCA